MRRTGADGQPINCQACGTQSFLRASTPSGDKICPACGSRLWISSLDLRQRHRLSVLRRNAKRRWLRRFALHPPRGASTLTSRFVADGYKRMVAGIETQARQEIGLQYADEWKASGLIKRWILRRRIEREVADRVADRSAHVSPKTLF